MVSSIVPPRGLIRRNRVTMTEPGDDVVDAGEDHGERGGVEHLGDAASDLAQEPVEVVVTVVPRRSLSVESGGDVAGPGPIRAVGLELGLPVVVTQHVGHRGRQSGIVELVDGPTVAAQQPHRALAEGEHREPARRGGVGEQGRDVEAVTDDRELEVDVAEPDDAGPVVVDEGGDGVGRPGPGRLVVDQGHERFEQDLPVGRAYPELGELTATLGDEVPEPDLLGGDVGAR
jgi:hypothetical protein